MRWVINKEKEKIKTQKGKIYEHNITHAKTQSSYASKRGNDIASKQSKATEGSDAIMTSTFSQKQIWLCRFTSGSKSI